MLRAVISSFALFAIASPVNAGAPDAIELIFDQLADAQKGIVENSCSHDVITSIMRLDLERYQNYAGLSDAEMQSEAHSVKAVIEMLAEIEWDFQDHGATLPDPKNCNLNYDRLATKLGY